MTTDTSNDPPSPQPAPEPTLGYLLMAALSTENAREHNRRAIERAAARSSLHGYITGMHVAALSAGDQGGDVPAALAIRAYTNREFGQDLTPEAVRRVRGRVCEVLDVDTAAADALPLSRVAELLRQSGAADDGTAGGDPAAADRWLKVAQVAALFALNRGTVSKLADAGTFVTNGRTGHDRRIDVLSVVGWNLGRLARQAAGDDPAAGG